MSALCYHLEQPVTAKLATARDIDAALNRLYDTKPEHDGSPSADSGSAEFVHEDDLQRLRDIASEAPIIRLAAQIIAAAVQQRASDIHIEPLADGLRVRYRIDGAMTEVQRLPLDVQSGVASRIKIMARLNIAERRLPQDGRTKAIVAGREIDLRVSTMPVLHGESIVLRILDQDQVDLSFEALGFSARNSNDLTKLLREPNGIILVTGPTGSGKTTTLYTALKILNTIDRKVFTVEDPIEYQLEGINQIQIKPGIGLDFVHCLRGILRQNPDAIMVGEMRDAETARIGIQASLTGHLVMSTLHTNSAAASVTRLLDMGVEDYLLASTVIGVLAQRLVRRLCTACSEAVPPDDALAERLELAFEGCADRPAINGLRRAVGCAHCRKTGYLGRTAIVETLPITNGIRALIKKGVTDREIDLAGRAHGMETLYQDGLRKAFVGLTTMDDVLRAARL